MKNILITGGAGFIGYELSKKLINKGFQVTILDNLSKKVHFNDSRYHALKDIANFIIGNVCSREDWVKAIIDQDAIVHLASETGTGESMYEIYNYTNVNICSTALMLDVLKNNEHNVKKIVLSSSRSVYGEGKYKSSDNNILFPKSRKISDLDQAVYDLKCSSFSKDLMPLPTDEDSDLNPSSIYSLTKYNQEKMLQLVCDNIDIQPIILRYQNVYGPGQSLSNPYTGILSIFSTRILNQNDIEVYEDGLQSRDFIFIDDVVEATCLALFSNKLRYSVYNIGTGHPQTVLSVAEKLKNLFKSDIKINISNRYRIGDIRHNFADVSRLGSDLNFSPRVAFDEGLERFVKWVQSQNIQKDLYDTSVDTLHKKGLIR